MVYGWIVEFNAQLSALGFHLSSYEVRAIISDDTVRDTITVDCAGYKIDHSSGLSCFVWFVFYPFSEFIHHDQQILSLMASSFKGFNHIESPDHKSPSDGDCL